MFASLRHRIAFQGGTTLLRKEWWRAAAFLLRRAAKLAPDHWESHNNLAVALLKLQRWEDAAKVAERAIRLDPTAVDSHDFFGIALLQLDRWEEAVAAYRRAITVDPDRYDAYDRLGMALSRLERWEDVVNTYEAALKLDAGRHGAHLRLGIALLQLGRWEAAAGAFRRALALAEHDPATAAEYVTGLQLYLENADSHRDAQATSERQAAFWSAGNLDSDVFAVQRWLEHLSVVSGQVPPGPRLLFVLDNDFGELTTVKYFVLGQELAGRTTLLLPDRLYVHNVDAIPGRTHRYASVDDILRVVDRERPEIVFLCSGYLFSPHLGFTPDDLARLVDQLRARGCRVVTADPFMGLMSQQDPCTLIRFEVSKEHAEKLAAVAHLPETVEELTRVQRAIEVQAWTMLRQTERILRDTYHLYPSYCDVAGDPAETDTRNIAFFNDRLLRPARSGEAGTPHWLFILATADCDIQSVSEGTAFVDIVASKLLETRAAGRHPILIAPTEFINELLPRMPTVEGIDLLAHCPFTRFMSLLLSAEHAFYWNVVSHSLLIRLFNQLPVVQFDRGHLVRTAPAIYDRIVAWYYQGWAPPLRDHRETLMLETVERWVAEYRQQAARLAERYRRAPSPDQMIADLMGRAPTPTSQMSASNR